MDATDKGYVKKISTDWHIHIDKFPQKTKYLYKESWDWMRPFSAKEFVVANDTQQLFENQ